MEPGSFAMSRGGPRRSPRRISGPGPLALLGATVLVVVAGIVSIQLFTDWLWFESLGFNSLFLRMLSTQTTLFAIAVLLFATSFTASVALARRLARSHQHLAAGEEDGIWAYVARVGVRVAGPSASVRLMSRGIVVLGLALALIMGLIASGQWDSGLRFLHAVPFGVSDPVFGRDVAFYLFALPFWRFVHSWLVGAVILIGTATVAIYVVVLVYELGISLERVAGDLTLGARLHIAGLGAALVALLGANHVLDLFELVYSNRSVSAGAGYADINAQVPALQIMAAVAGIWAVLSLVSGWTGSVRPAAAGLGLWAAAAVLGGLAYPSLVQNFQVRPNELDRERPYIAYSIRMTRQAYGLDQVEERFFPAEDSVSPADVRANQETLDNVRLWDHRPLRDTLNQIQSIRTYYNFNDVDIDRYVIDGRYRQVMIAARELAPEQLQSQARTWVNQRLQFTHGYGAAMALVSAIAEEGRPRLVVQDVPPQGALAIERPEIYFGERTLGYVVVNTNTPEFDYPRGDENATSRFQGSSGIRIGGPLERLAFALRFQDFNLLLSDALTPESRLHFRRQIADRVHQIAPFLLLDRDPYLVLAEGKLFWVLDAYTHSNAYPYSQPRLWSPRGPVLNYIRNSVKATVSAYDGQVHLYVADESDPVIRTYAGIFPELFEPLSAMPSELRAHLRYPEDLFAIQANVFQTFHMQDPTVFYNKEDVWSLPFERFYGEKRPVEPYYVIMRLPDERQPEFLLMQPFTPLNKDNMIAWLAGRSDGEHAGKLLLFKYPKERLVYGPFQVEGRIDQDPSISAQFTLWSQAGSQVIRGNLLVIPLGNSNLYVEPIYLQAENGPIPELKRVVLSTGNRVVMEPTLELALDKLFGTDGVAAQPGAQPSSAAQPSPSQAAPRTGAPVESATVNALARSASEHYTLAQSALREGNWARYGEELRAMENDLRQLVELTAGAQP
jgi:uncharacterized membrane protein (UPF0182 family)